MPYIVYFPIFLMTNVYILYVLDYNLIPLNLFDHVIIEIR